MKAGRKERNKEGREEGKKDGRKKEGRKERRKKRRKEGSTFAVHKSQKDVTFTYSINAANSVQEYY
jgi:predicted transposase YdaD